MCLLMVTMGEMPDRDYLYNACDNNPDGFGFAVNHGDRIVTGRSMKHERLIERFTEEMSKSKNPVGMFHARYTTHGTTTLENNHPFRVDGRVDTVLAHNGVLPISPRAGDDRSDTRIFAEDILGSIGLKQLDSKGGFATLEEFVSGSKVAILTNAPELRDSVYILNEDLGHWDNNIWWSNYSYQYAYYGYGKAQPIKHYAYGSDAQAWGDGGTVIGGRNWWNEDYDQAELSSYGDVSCNLCGLVASTDSLYSGICLNCDSCLDCAEHTSNCLCYTPTTAIKQSTDLLPLNGVWAD